MIRKRFVVPAAAALLAALLAMSGCAPAVRTAMFRPAYPPTQTVDVYRTKTPDRPYVEIAELRAYEDGNALGRIVDKAKTIGADGVIVIGEKYEGTRVFVEPRFLDDWSSGYERSTTPVTELVAMAIKYR